MSAYTVIQTDFVSAEHLRAALLDMGFPEVELHRTAQPLEGYMGDSRAQRAEVIVRKKHVGSASNDIGFARQPDGRLRAYISDYDRARHDAAWLGRLTQAYAYHVVKAELERQDFTLVTQKVDQDNTVRLTLRRMR